MIIWGLNYHQSKGVLTDIHYWLANHIMSTFGQKWKEPGMIMQVIRKAPEEKASNCPHNIIYQSNTFNHWHKN